MARYFTSMLSEMTDIFQCDYSLLDHSTAKGKQKEGEKHGLGGT